MKRDWVVKASLDASRASKREFFDRSSVKRKLKYPWLDIEPGQSFVVYDVKRNSLATAANGWSNISGRTYSINKEGDGFRVTRKE